MCVNTPQPMGEDDHHQDDFKAKEGGQATPRPELGEQADVAPAQDEKDNSVDAEADNITKLDDQAQKREANSPENAANAKKHRVLGAYNIENDLDNKKKWIYNTKNTCDQAVCITAEYHRRIKKLEKFCTRHSVGCYLKDDPSSWMLINLHLPTKWAADEDFYKALPDISDQATSKENTTRTTF